MNAWGPAGCREHIEDIVDRLEKKATERGWKIRVPKVGGITRIIGRLPAGENALRWACKQMVLVAIRRAERDAEKAGSNRLADA